MRKAGFLDAAFDIDEEPVGERLVLNRSRHQIDQVHIIFLEYAQKFIQGTGAVIRFNV